MRTNNKDINKILNILQQKGYNLIRERHNHIKIYDADRLKLTVCSTPSDYRAIKNIAAEIKRTLGFKIMNLT